MEKIIKRITSFFLAARIQELMQRMFHPVFFETFQYQIGL
jgi:hypothetical protein